MIGKLSMSKKTLTPFVGSLFFLILFLVSGKIALAQCSGGSSGGALATPTGTFQTSTFSSKGIYKTFTATAGATYNFSFCSNGGSASYDTQITILDNSGFSVAGGYNDDFCGLQSDLTWIATSSGTFRVLVTEYDCVATGAVSATLAYALVEPQYNGGNRDGWYTAKATGIPLSNIYGGGNRDGWVSAKTLSTPLSNIYVGGSDQGWSLGSATISSPPVVSTLLPADDATAVAANSNLVLTFSENVQKGTGNIIIKVGGVVSQTIPVTDATVTVSGATVTINPPTDFPSSGLVNVEMAAGVFKDLANNDFVGITAATTWNFTVADIIAPTITTLSPLDNAIGVLQNSNLVITFNETIQKGTGNIIIKEGGITTQTIPVTDASVSIAGAVVTINPTDFASSAAVNVEMAAGVFKDLANNNFAGIISSTIWNFTVAADVVAPTVVSYSPLDNATNVTVNSNLVITFNENVQKGSGNVIIKEGGIIKQTIPVSDASVTIAGAVVTINPADFTSSALVNVEMASGVLKDLSNNNFAGITNSSTWDFTVADVLPPIISTLTPLDDATEIAQGANLIIIFNEAIQKGTGNIFIKEDGVLMQTIAVTDGNVSVSGNTAIIDPSDFGINKLVNIEMEAGVFKDLANNNFSGILNSTSWNFTSAAAVQIVNQSFVSTYDKGSSITVSITVNDAAKTSAVNFKSRGISEPASALKSTAVTAVGNKFEKVIAASELTDPIGINYYFEVVDKNQVSLSSAVGEANAKYLASSQEQIIPSLSFGNQISNYQIIAVPLDLTNKSVTSVFSALGSYNKKKWRLFEYANNDNKEFGESGAFTTIVPNKGYWLIVKDQATINPGEGKTVGEDDAKFDLTVGWNLIGNPYNFRVSWTDILAANSNPTGVDTNLKVFIGGTTLTNGTVLEKYRGAFVFSNQSVTLKVPATRNLSLGGRTANEAFNTINSKHWEVKLVLSDGFLSNELGGIGMDPKATLLGKDQFDEVSVPLPDGLGLFELAYPHPEVFTSFNKEVVPTQENFTWTFDVKRSSQHKDLELSWANDYFGDNEKRLVLFDPITLHVIDMKQANRFTITERTEKIKILFGDHDYVQSILDGELPWIGEPYPNPSHADVMIPFRITEGQDQNQVQIKVYNSQGIEVAKLVDRPFMKGNYEVNWQPTKAGGLYFIRMKIGQHETKAMKVIIN